MIDAAAGRTCPTCRESVVVTRDGDVCGCTGLSAPGPRAAFERAAAAVARGQVEGQVNVVILGMEE